MSTLLTPEGWTVKELGDIAHIERSGVPPEQIVSGTAFVGLENITSEGFFSGVANVQAGDLASTKFSFNRDHILYGKLRPNLKKIARPSFEGICSTDILPISPDKSIDLDFLYHFLRQPQLVDLAITRCSGANLPRLSPKTLATFPISFPPLDEQRRIAAILDKADAIRRKRQEAIQLTEELLRSTFLEMFGDPVTNPKGWPIVKLEDVFAEDRAGTCCGPFGSALKKHEYVTRGIPVWGIDNVTDNYFVEEGSLFITQEKYENLARYSVLSGDILISRAGTVGRMCVAKPRAPVSIIGSNLIRLSLNQSKMLPEYLTSLFSYLSDRLRGLRASSDENAYSFMNTTILKGVEVPLPSPGTQSAYIDFLNKIRLHQDKIGNSSAISEHLFSSLVQRAFRGEL
jgi:type I restriction enzyme, S subunit